VGPVPRRPGGGDGIQGEVGAGGAGPADLFPKMWRGDHRGTGLKKHYGQI